MSMFLPPVQLSFRFLSFRGLQSLWHPELDVLWIDTDEQCVSHSESE